MNNTNPITSFLFNSNKDGDESPFDQSAAAQQKKILSVLISDFQKPQKQKTTILYDPLSGITQLFRAPAESKAKQSKFLDKIKKALVCSCLQRQQQQSYKIIAVLFSSLKKDEQEWLQRHYSKYDREELGQLKYEYVEKMQNSLSLIHSEIQADNVQHETKEAALKLVDELKSVYNQIDSKKHRIFNFQLHKDKTYIFAMMISAFQIFSKGYNTYQRAKLKKIFYQLHNQSYSAQNWVQVLRFLQSKDPIVFNLKPLDQSNLDWNVALYADQYIKLSNMKIQKTKIGLIKVSQSIKRRKVVNLLISGFLSQDQDKKKQWNQLLACMPESQVYGLQWESNTITRLVKFLVLSIKDLIKGTTVEDLCRKDNPFIPAFEIAIQTGQILAYIVQKMFPNQFINIIGYSLGSQLIRSFVEKSIQLNGGVNLNKVILMGGVSDINQFENTLKQTRHSISILNCRSKYDTILRHVLKVAKPGINPVGLKDIKSTIQHHLINNIDLSKKINGHFAYMTSFGVVAQHLALNEQ